MANDGRPQRIAVHATAVAIGARALLILGPSRAGKSRLAWALVAASTRRTPIRLVGDDRVLLTPSRKGLLARPHPRIAGFIERRGLGIVAVPFVAAAPVAAVVTLAPTTICIEALQNLPSLAGVDPDAAGAARLLAWWRGALTTPYGKSVSTPVGATQDWNW